MLNGKIKLVPGEGKTRAELQEEHNRIVDQTIQMARNAMNDVIDIPHEIVLDKGCPFDELNTIGS